MRLVPSLRRLLRDERGVSLIELGLIAPFLSLLVVGSVDLGKGLSERYALQQAAHRTIELANVRTLTAQSNSDEIDYSFLVQEAAASAGVPANQVTLTRWVECDGAVMEAYDMVCDPGEQVARYIQLQIIDYYVPMFGLARIYPLVNRNGSVTMRVEAAIRIQ